MCAVTRCASQEVGKVEHKECNAMTCSTLSFINEQRGRVTKRLNKDTEHHREVRHTELDDGQKVVTSETKCLHFDTISNCTPSYTSCTFPSNDLTIAFNAAPL